MMWGYGYGGWWGPLLMSVTTVLFWVLLVAMIVALLRYVRPSSERSPADSSSGRARALLAERLARGEIDEDEYRRRRSLLGDHAPSTG